MLPGTNALGLEPRSAPAGSTGCSADRPSPACPGLRPGRAGCQGPARGQGRGRWRGRRSACERACTTSPRPGVFRSPFPAAGEAAGEGNAVQSPWYLGGRGTEPPAGPALPRLASRPHRSASPTAATPLPEELGSWFVPARPAAAPESSAAWRALVLARRPGGRPWAARSPAAAPGDRLPDLAMAYPSEMRHRDDRRRRAPAAVHDDDREHRRRARSRRGSSRLAGRIDDGRQPADLQQRRRLSRAVDTKATAQVLRRRPRPLARPGRRPLRALRDHRQGRRPAPGRQGRVLLLRHERVSPYRCRARRDSPKYYGRRLREARRRCSSRTGSASAGATSTAGASAASGSTSADLPAGEYFLKVTVDPLFLFQEIRHRNNCNWLANPDLARRARP